VVAWIGRKSSEGVEYAAELLYLGYLSLRELFSRSSGGRTAALAVVARQIIFTGVDALPVVTVIALLIGLLVIIVAATTFSLVGASALLAHIIVVTIVREIGPLFTAFIVVWRSGTAIATELGNMRVGREIDALEAMGVNLIRFVVMPRVVGTVVALLCLTVCFDVVAVLGGFLVAMPKLTIPLSVYLDDIAASLSLADVVITVIKAALFGLTIALICVYHGLSVARSSTEVPQQTTRAMLNTVTICLVLDIMVTVGAYL
jgi:phospholipid/cholesterol/gamma-HCH transport system permease protein